MGSWNHTCAITNLPIYSGEPVYVLLLQEGAGYDKFVGSHCYANNYYTPLPLCFEGEANEYGAVEDCHGDYLETILGCVKEKLIEFDLGENKYHDIAVKKDGFDVNMLFEADHESRLYVQCHEYDQEKKRAPRRLTHIVIRKEVVDTLLEKYKANFWDKDNGYKHTQISFKDALSKDIELLLKQGEDVSDTMETYNRYKEMGRLESFHKVYGTTVALDTYFVRWAAEGYFLKQNVIDINRIIFDFLINSPEKLESLIRNVMIVRWLDDLHGNGRRMWIRPSGCGSQNTEVNAQKMVSQLINVGIKQMKEYYKNW